MQLPLATAADVSARERSQQHSAAARPMAREVSLNTLPRERFFLRCRSSRVRELQAMVDQIEGPPVRT
jgi:hypothetical protein